MLGCICPGLRVGLLLGVLGHCAPSRGLSCAGRLLGLLLGVLGLCAPRLPLLSPPSGSSSSSLPLAGTLVAAPPRHWLCAAPPSRLSLVLCALTRRCPSLLLRARRHCLRHWRASFVPPPPRQWLCVASSCCRRLSPLAVVFRASSLEASSLGRLPSPSPSGLDPPPDAAGCLSRFFTS